MHDDIQKKGAEAARKGMSLLNCPYLKAAAMPAHTGEPPGDWIQRVADWEAGWKREVALRELKHQPIDLPSLPKKPAH